MKIAICTIIKNENLYLREWVEYHKNLGFDNIIIYDNNDPCGEYPQQVIGDYIDSGYIIIHNKRHLHTPGFAANVQGPSFNECLDIYGNDFEWILFIDIDEFVEIPDIHNIHDLFASGLYDQYEQVVLSWKVFGDSGKLFYEDKPIRERFTQPIHDVCITGRTMTMNQHVKSMVHTSTQKRFFNIHALYYANTCNAYGQLVSWFDSDGMSIPCHKVIYLNHYYTKSLEEFIVRRLDLKDYNDALHIYQSINTWTPEHQRIFNQLISYK